jgi:hypothetical protein
MFARFASADVAVSIATPNVFVTNASTDVFVWNVYKYVSMECM